MVEFFRQFYGPANRAFAALGTEQQAALRSELEALWSRYNLTSDGGTRIEAEYIEVFATRA